MRDQIQLLWMKAPSAESKSFYVFKPRRKFSREKSTESSIRELNTHFVVQLGLKTSGFCPT